MLQFTWYFLFIPSIQRTHALLSLTFLFYFPIISKHQASSIQLAISIFPFLPGIYRYTHTYTHVRINGFNIEKAQ